MSTTGGKPSCEKLDLLAQALDQMLCPTPTAAVHLQEKFTPKEQTDTFKLKLSAMHPFGEPTYGWMPKKHLMTAVRLIDSSKKHKSRAD